MSRGRKIALIIGGSLLGLILLVGIAIFVTVQTDWFRNFVRTKIIATVEEATGGRVELGSFNFTWSKLRADINNFVLHGLEPAGAEPLFRAKHLQVDLKLLSPLKGFVDIAYLLVDTPRANVIVFADGKTNIPAPKIKKKPSDKSGLETVVDLAIGRFDLVNAGAVFTDHPAAFNANGQNLRARLAYNHLHPSYTGEIDIAPLFLKSGNNQALNVNVKMPIAIEADKITLTNAQLETPKSKVVISGELDHLADPQPHTSAHINASLSIDEAHRVSGLDIPLD